MLDGLLRDVLCLGDFMGDRIMLFSVFLAVIATLRVSKATSIVIELG